MVRAKFRCLSITQKLEGWFVELKPVIAKSKTWPGGSEENLRFWDASPSGEANFSYPPEASVPFTVGSYYYIDLHVASDPDAPRTWKLWELAQGVGSLGVSLSLGWDNEHSPRAADIHIDIANEEAWPPFNDRRAGSRWSVDVTLAESPAQGLMTYP